MPAPRSMLLASGQWKRYAVPYLVSGARSRSLGLRRVPALYEGVAPQSFGWAHLALFSGVLTKIRPRA
eukprot:1630894-Alexandrium_andersonii.AAC.1